MAFTVLSLPHNLQKYVSEHWYDPGMNMVTIRLSSHFENGTDTEAYEASRLFHAICTQGYMLRVLPHRIGGWVPSRKNPMTVEWTKILIE